MKVNSRMNIKASKRKKNFRRNVPFLLLALPAIIVILIMNYFPMFGLLLAFKNYNFSDGFLGSPWVGLKNFDFFFSSMQAWRITRNTIGMNLMFIAGNLIISVGFAVILNEVKSRMAVKLYQTAMFFPYFISWVVAGIMLYAFLNSEFGILNGFLAQFGIEKISWYSEWKYWPFILFIMYIWKHAGYSTLVYYATILGFNDEYYEAAYLDGATRWQCVTKITIPMLVPIITMMTLLNIGKIFYADFGLFFQLPRDIGLLYPTTDVIDTYVYRTLKVTGDVGMSAAVGFYQSVVGFILVIVSNLVVRKINEENALF